MNAASPTNQLLIDVTPLQGQHYTVRAQLFALLESDLQFSDIFIHQDSPMMVKMPRRNMTIASAPIEAQDLIEFFMEIDPTGAWKEDIKDGAYDRAIMLEQHRIRVHCITFEGRNRYGAIIRRFPSEPKPLHELGLQPSAFEFPKLTRGLILVIGDTGQGKSHTLASIIHEINKTRPGHIVTIEDPVEIIVPQINCLITHREVGPNSDVKSFYVGARDALRERPDVVVIGEIRDEDCAREAFTLSESGPLVITTLHAKSIELGLSKLHRFLGGTAANAQAMGKALKAVLCQALVPSVNGDRDYLATECLTNNPAFSKLIEEANFNEVRTLIKKLSKEPDGQNVHGCHTLNFDLERLHREKKITAEDARRTSNDMYDDAFNKTMSVAVALEVYKK